MQDMHFGAFSAHILARMCIIMPSGKYICSMIELFTAFLSGVAMPILLLGCGTLFCAKLGFFWLVHPIRTVRSLVSRTQGTGHSPLRALTVALAGTLGVGNIAGVATAITAGGAGAVFWMWVSALLAMGVKYAEVAFALAHRRRECSSHTDISRSAATQADNASHKNSASLPGKTTHGCARPDQSLSSSANEGRAAHRFYGGAMYYIRDSVSPFAGGLFAILCIANAAVTGNVLQSNAAASVFSERIPPIAVGIVFCALTAAVTLGSAKRISDVTVRLIPALVAVYFVLSAVVITSNLSAIPGVFSRIFREAFGLRSAAGGAAGIAVSRAIRFGVTRGILSNEAGSGTSPTAHAAADTNDAHRQGIFGIFEVFADTVVICTLTAVVILLLPDFGSEDGVRLAVLAYGTFAGDWAGEVIRVSVVLFAFATVICQAYYGEVALGYFSRSDAARKVYLICYSALCIAGSVIDPARMWLGADLVISLMTAMNVAVLLYAFARRRYRTELLPWAYRLR